MILTDSGDPTRKIFPIDVIPIILHGSTRYDVWKLFRTRQILYV